MATDCWSKWRRIKVVGNLAVASCDRKIIRQSWKPGEYQRGHDVHVAPSLKDLGIEKNSSHDERSVLKLNDLGIEESVVTRCHHTQNGFNHRWASPWFHDGTTGQCTKAGRPTEITSNTMWPVILDWGTWQNGPVAWCNQSNVTSLGWFGSRFECVVV